MSLEYVCDSCKKAFFGQSEKRYFFDKDSTKDNMHGRISEFCEKCALEFDIEIYRRAGGHVLSTKDLTDLTDLPYKNIRTIEETGNKFYCHFDNDNDEE